MLQIIFLAVAATDKIIKKMYKTSVYTLVNDNIQGLAHRKQQKLQKVILPASH